MGNLKHDTIPVANEHLLKVIVLELSIFLVASLLCLFSGRSSLQLSLNAFKITLHASDCIFVLALLIITVNLYNFYKKIICVIGESVIDSLISLLSMLFMFALSLVIFFEEMFQYRFFVIFGLSMAVLWKNIVLRRQLRGHKLGMRFNRWAKQAAWSCCLSIIGALVFFVMFDRGINPIWFRFLVEGNGSTLSSHYYEVIPALFYLTFLLYALRLFITDSNYFASDDFRAEMMELDGG